MAIGDIWKLSVVGRNPNQNALVNTFHYRQDNIILLTSEAEDLYNAWWNTLETVYKNCIANNIGLDTIQVRQITGGLAGQDFALGAQTGNLNNGDTLPSQCAAVITWRTGMIGRSKRGRSYFFPAPEGNQANGTWIPGYVASLQAFADASLAIQSVLLGPVWTHVVWSPTLAVEQEITDGFPRPTVYTQRRRVTGVGA